MNATTIKFEPKPASVRHGVNYDRRRMYLRWYWTNRWTYVHARWHRCGTLRADGHQWFFWLALGPFDLRIHV